MQFLKDLIASLARKILALVSPTAPPSLYHDRRRKVDRQQVVFIYNETGCIAETARQLSCTESTITRALKKAGAYKRNHPLRKQRATFEQNQSESDAQTAS